MIRTIDYYPYNQKKVIHNNSVAEVETYLTNFWNRPAVLLGSARAGIFQILNFFKFSRQDNILVPKFLCQSILNIINTSGFPVKQIDSGTKAVLVHHQWGYPQKMDEVLAKAREYNLIVIEDCVHSFDSKYKGQHIGSFGDVAIYSFSKCFQTYTGGVVSTANKELVEYVRRSLKSVSQIKNSLFNFFSFIITKKYFDKGIHSFWFDWVYSKSIDFPNIGIKTLKLLPSSSEEFKQGLKRRKKNYLFFKERLKSEYLLADQDQDIEVNPWCVPVFLPEDMLAKAQVKLNNLGVLTEILHFDLNRNIFDSKYQRCLALPCHQQLEEKKLEEICCVINSF